MASKVQRFRDEFFPRARISLDGFHISIQDALRIAKSTSSASSGYKAWKWVQENIQRPDFTYTLCRFSEKSKAKTPGASPDNLIRIIEAYKQHDYFCRKFMERMYTKNKRQKVHEPMDLVESLARFPPARKPKKLIVAKHKAKEREAGGRKAKGREARDREARDREARKIMRHTRTIAAKEARKKLEREVEGLVAELNQRLEAKQKMMMDVDEFELVEEPELVEEEVNLAEITARASAAVNHFQQAEENMDVEEKAKMDYHSFFSRFRFQGGVSFASQHSEQAKKKEKLNVEEPESPVKITARTSTNLGHAIDLQDDPEKEKEKMLRMDVEEPRPRVATKSSEYGVMNISDLDFEGCRRKGNWISVVDAIGKFRGQPKEKAKDTWKDLVRRKKVIIAYESEGKVDGRKFPTLAIEIKKIQFMNRVGQLGTPIPCVRFKDLIRIFSKLPGPQAAALQEEQSEITARVLAGDPDLARNMMERHEAKEKEKMLRMDVEEPEPRVTTKSSEYGVMKISGIDFEGCRRKGNWISVVDAIAKFRGQPKEKAKKTWNDIVRHKKVDIAYESEGKVDGRKFPTLAIEIKKIQFMNRVGQLGTPIPCVRFKDLIRIFSKLPGTQAATLRQEQAEITARASAGDLDLKHAIGQRHIDLQDDPETQDLLQSGMESVVPDPVTPRVRHEQPPPRRINVTEASPTDLMTMMLENKLDPATVKMFMDHQLALGDQRLKEGDQRLKEKALDYEHERASWVHGGSDDEPRTRRTQTRFTPAMMGKLWKHQFGRDAKFFQLCPRCPEKKKHMINIIGAKVNAHESKTTNAAFYSMDNLQIMCKTCSSRRHHGPVVPFRWNKDRVQTWLSYMGTTLTGTCYVCPRPITMCDNDWERGHVIAACDDGSDEQTNLRPVCAHCNTAMGDQNLEAYARAHGYTLRDANAVPSRKLDTAYNNLKDLRSPRKIQRALTQ